MNLLPFISYYVIIIYNINFMGVIFMNDVIKGLHARKSVRMYEDTPVSEEIKTALINATLQAPSAGNQILYSIIDVTDQALKDTLVKTCDDQLFIGKAPLVFVFVADHTRWMRSYNLAETNPRKLGVGDLMLAVTDTAIAAQNMVVAAESLGLGSCYIGDIMERCDIHRELFNLPEHAVPVCMLVIGYPTESQKKRPKPARFDKKYIVGENTYLHLSDDEIVSCYTDRRDIWTPKMTQEFKPFMEAFCKRKYNSTFSIEMTKSIGKYLKSFETFEEE